MARTSKLRGALFTALTGNRGDVSGGGGDIGGMLLAVGGASRRTRSGIDLTAAAGKLGVSRRTVERWLKASQTGAGHAPSPVHAKNLARAAQRAATTQAGRRAGLAATRVKASAAAGARLSMTGRQGPLANGQVYARNRTTQLDLDPQALQSMLDAYERGGDKAFVGWATQHWGQQYLDDWQFETIDDVKVETPEDGTWRAW